MVLLDFQREEEQLEEDIHWAAETGSRVLSDLRKSTRKLKDRIKGLKAELEVLEARRDYLQGIIDGRIRPSAVDLPEEEADGFMTKLRLRVKGVRGIAVEKAKDEIGPLEERIEGIERRIRSADEGTKPLEKKISEADKVFSELAESLRTQRSLLRKASAMYNEIAATTDIFGWYNPYVLARKSFEEAEISRRKLAAKTFSVERLEREIEGLEEKANGLKKELRSVLGEAYDASLMHIVFKDGRSPTGRRFLQNELTVGDVESLDIMNKLSHSKTVARKADRLSSVLWNHRNFILESLLRMGHVCELKLYDLRLLELAQKSREAARRLHSRRIELFHRIISAAESCGRLDQALSDYHMQAVRTADHRSRAKAIAKG